MSNQEQTKKIADALVNATTKLAQKGAPTSIEVNGDKLDMPSISELYEVTKKACNEVARNNLKANGVNGGLFQGGFDNC